MSSTSKKKKKTGPFLTVLILICVAVLAFSAYKLGSIYLAYKEGTDEYRELRQYTESLTPELVPVSESTAEETVSEASGTQTPPIQVNFDALKAINPDIVGWIYIGAVDISYPVVHGTDNDYYLHRTFEKKDNFSGSIFMEAENQPDFSDPNTIIYGHNMKNGSMFGMLKHLTSEDKYRENPYFWVLTPEGNYCYQMFSIRQVKTDSRVYTLFSGADQQLVDYANQMKSESEVTLESPEFTTESKIVTLSTCTSDSESRYVVQGVRMEIG